LKRRILVVDDDDSVRRSLARALSARGFHVVTAKDAEEALKAALEHRLTVIIMDLQLPLMSGSEVVRRLRTLGRSADVPVIALSATPEDASSTLFQQVLTKPCSVEVLVGAIEAAAKATNSSAREPTSKGVK